MRFRIKKRSNNKFSIYLCIYYNYSGIDRENEAKQDHDEFTKSIKMEIKMKQDKLNLFRYIYI